MLIIVCDDAAVLKAVKTWNRGLGRSLDELLPGLPKVRVFRAADAILVLQAAHDRAAASAGIVLGRITAEGIRSNDLHWVYLWQRDPADEAPVTIVAAVSPGRTVPRGWYPDLTAYLDVPEAMLEDTQLPDGLGVFLAGFAGLVATDQVSAFCIANTADAVRQAVDLAETMQRLAKLPGWQLDEVDRRECAELGQALRLTASEQRILQERLQELRVRSGSYEPRLHSLAAVPELREGQSLPRSSRDTILQRILGELTSRDAAPLPENRNSI